MRYGEKWPEYARQWDAMIINASRRAEFERLAQFALEHKAEYQEIEAATGVPWSLIAVIHRRESDADFTTYLGNGEPLSRETKLVPKGRGPFASFKDGAIDALNYDGLTKVIDWRLEKQLFYCERFNGPGYHSKGLPSPYVWGGTSIQRPGKYIADHTWSSTTMDTQPGCAPLLWSIAQLDPSIRFVRETPMGVDTPAVVLPPAPTIPPPMADNPRLDELMAKLRPILAEYVGAAPVITPEMIKALIVQTMGGVMPTTTGDGPAPPTTPITKPPPATGLVDKPSVQASAVALGISTALQLLGFVGTPFGMGETPTEAGTIATLTPLITGVIGSTGAFGATGQAVLGFLSALGAAASKAQKPK